AELVAALDLDSLELKKDSFIDEELRESYSDLLYSVQLAEQDGQRGPERVRLTCPNSCRRFWVCRSAMKRRWRISRSSTCKRSPSSFASSSAFANSAA
ncbi:MAG: Rpn family recombination-promoting nuclease/putative transposase, partial [Pirellula sp.]